MTNLVAMWPIWFGLTVPSPAIYRHPAQHHEGFTYAAFRPAFRADEIRHGPRQTHGLYRCRRRRYDRIPARQSHFLISLAQYHALLRGPRAAHRLRDRK